MAFSTQRTTSDGTLVLLDISIEYFDRSEIAVLFNGVVNAYPWAWVGLTESKISFTPAVPNTVEVMLVRTTDLAKVRHMFTLGAQFTTESLDEDLLQILHIAQEAKENATVEEVFHNLNMHGYRITSIGNGIDPQDAPSMAQMVVHDAQVVVYRDQAAVSAAAAAASAASIDVTNLLSKAANLSDVANTATARANLGLIIGTDVLAPTGSASGMSDIHPAGAVSMFAMATAPAGWLKANGAAVSRTTYATLFAAIGTLYGVGDGSSTFNLPDLRGEFLRGFDDGRGVDTARVLGTAQADELKAHTHGLGLRPNMSAGGGVGIDAGTAFAQSGETYAFGGTETRPRNIALLVCIKT